MTMTENRIRALFHDLSSAIAKLETEVSPKMVHRLRTNIRRIESLVDYSRPRFSRKQRTALKDLSSLRKRAGKVRDLDIQIGLLGVAGDSSTAADRRTLEDILQRKRTKQADRLLATVQKLERSEFASRIRQLAKAVSTSRAATKDPNTPFRLAEKKIADLARHYGPEPQLKSKRLHQLRIQLKLVRYLAELAEESEEQHHLLQQFKAVQDALGDWHDWEEFSRTTENQFRRRSNCAILVEVGAQLAVRHASALFAVSQLFSRYAPARRQPRPVSSPALAQRA